MRNTLQFPITKTEIIETLNDASKALDSDCIGDIRPYILERIKIVFETMTDDTFKKFIKEINA